MSKNDSDSEAFYAILCLFIEQREGRPFSDSYRWKAKDLEYVLTAFAILSDERKRDMLERFKDYQINAALRALYPQTITH